MNIVTPNNQLLYTDIVTHIRKQFLPITATCVCCESEVLLEMESDLYADTVKVQKSPFDDETKDEWRLCFNCMVCHEKNSIEYYRRPTEKGPYAGRYKVQPNDREYLRILDHYQHKLSFWVFFYKEHFGTTNIVAKKVALCIFALYSFVVGVFSLVYYLFQLLIWLF